MKQTLRKAELLLIKTKYEQKQTPKNEQREQHFLADHFSICNNKHTKNLINNHRISKIQRLIKLITQ